MKRENGPCQPAQRLQYQETNGSESFSQSSDYQYEVSLYRSQLPGGHDLNALIK